MLLEIVDVLSDHLLSYLVHRENSQFFSTPTLKEPKGLLIALHGLGTEFPTSAVVHVLIDVVVKVPDQSIFLHKKCPRFIEKLTQ